MTQIVITVNGPGEIAGWFIPVARLLKQKNPGARIVTALLPCAFASGNELELLLSLPEVDAACSVRDTLALIMWGRAPVGLQAEKTALLLHLGGDPAWSWLLAKRLGVPCHAYVEAPFLLQNFFDRVFFAGLKPIPPSKQKENTALIGDLVVDAAWMNSPDRALGTQIAPAVSLYPGSRDYLVTYTLPFLAEVVDLVAKHFPNIKWKLAKADFLSKRLLQNLPDVNDGRQLVGQNLKWRSASGNDPDTLVTEAGHSIAVVDHAEASAQASLAITIPGTMTAELAALGVPMLVILPLVHSEKVPLPGPLNYISLLPFVGDALKRVAGRVYLRRMRFSAHPNRRANRMVVPELVGRLTAEQVAAETIRLLSAPRDQISAELRTIMGERGAAKTLVAALSAYLENSQPVIEDRRAMAASKKRAAS